MAWEPIETAPRDETVVRIRCESHPEYGEHIMHWDARHHRWMGIHFGVMGSRPTWWDETAPQPTHWEPLEHVGA